MSAAACTAGSNSGGKESASCVNRFIYQDRSYRDVANVDFTVGTKLGAATKPPCEDTGGREKDEEPATTETAYKVDGISPKVAIAVGDTPEEATFFAAYSGSELPPEVQRLIDGS
ncbi:DUF6281 family protein [Streptomyces sp. NPDC056831]|uniref:DUF6281 family protein n=1 Tax=Streptomyces sp. NPDC056831 TaxID=3345954 RepID=UPI0036B4AA98